MRGLRPWALLLAVVLACVTGAWLGRARPVYTELLPGEPSTLNPHLSVTAPVQTVGRFIYSSLTRVDPGGAILPDLALTWESGDGGRTWHFELDPRAKWHDGRSLRPADVAFTLSTVTQPECPGPWSGMWRIVAATVSGEHEVEVVLTEQRPLFPREVAAMPILPQHVLGLVPLRQWPQHQASSAPIGTGPFTLASRDKGRRLELKANPAYHLGQPGLETVTFIWKRVPALSAKDVAGRATAGALGRGPVWSVPKGYRLLPASGPGFAFIAFSLAADVPFFQERGVRQAWVRASGRDEVMHRAAGIGVRPLDGPYLGEQGAPIRLASDPAAARSLLERAGWRAKDRDGIMQRDGVRFQATLEVLGQRSDFVAAARILARNLRQAGMDVTVKPISFERYLQVIGGSEPFHVLLGYWSVVPSLGIGALFHSTASTQAGGANFTGYASPVLDKIVWELDRVQPGVRRSELVAECLGLMAVEVPYQFLWAVGEPFLVRDTLKGPQPGPFDRYWNVHLWKLGG
ncbi:MAG: ABC transporter substrate-binding protein [Bacillota bacterium]